MAIAAAAQSHCRSRKWISRKGVEQDIRCRRLTAMEMVGLQTDSRPWTGERNRGSFGAPWEDCRSRVFLWGDSHAAHLAPILDTILSSMAPRACYFGSARQHMEACTGTCRTVRSKSRTAGRLTS